jgi:hypothetical protein
MDLHLATMVVELVLRLGSAPKEQGKMQGTSHHSFSGRGLAGSLNFIGAGTSQHVDTSSS